MALNTCNIIDAYSLERTANCDNSLALSFESLGLVYYSFLIFTSVMALSYKYAQGSYQLKRGWNVFWYFFFIYLWLLIGLRHDVGGDWSAYVKAINIARTLNFSEIWGFGSDPSYGFLNWITAKYFTYSAGTADQWSGVTDGRGCEIIGVTSCVHSVHGLGDISIYVVNLICAFIFVYALTKFCKKLERPWLALVIACPYLITVVAMGYTRQATAIAFIFIGLLALNQGKIFRFVFFLFVATTFHRSALVLLPLAPMVFLTTRKFNFMIFISLVIATSLVSIAILSTIYEKMYDYLTIEINASGAFIRVAMVVIPAAIYLFYRRLFVTNKYEKSVYTLLSLGAFGLVFLFLALPSSAVVDRIALYWYSLQLFVFSSIPDALGKRGRANFFWVLGIVLYSFVILTVWVAFASHNYSYIPYKFYLFEMFSPIEIHLSND